jgi:hypothetical protein
MERRQQRADNEPLVILGTQEGYRVYAPGSPGRFYEVKGLPEAPTCTCADFENHKQDSEWRCKHILAAATRTRKQKPAPEAPRSEETEERRAIQEEARSSAAPPAVPAPTQLVLRRNISPDRRIDSLSVELTCPVGGIPAEEIRTTALGTIKIQDGIVQRFLDAHRPAPRPARIDNASGETARPAWMMSVGQMQTRRGQSLFITVDVNGQSIKLFGSRQQLRDAVLAAGGLQLAERLDEGVELNLPCRVVTMPTQNGKYLRIEKVLPPVR